MRREAPGEGPHRKRRYQGKQNVGSVKRNLADVAENCQQERQIPDIQRRMRMAAHIDHIAKEDIARVIGMERIDLRVLGSSQIVDVIALNGLTEKLKPDQQDSRDDDREPGRGAGFQSAALALLL